MKLSAKKYYDSLRLTTLFELNDYFKKYPPETLDEFEWTRLTSQGVFSSVALIRKYAKNIDWKFLCSMQKLTEDILEENSKLLDWYSVAMLQKLSWDFIHRHIDELPLDALVKNDFVRSNSSCLKKVLELYEKQKTDQHYLDRWHTSKMCSAFRPIDSVLRKEQEKMIDDQKLKVVVKDEEKKPEIIEAPIPEGTKRSRLTVQQIEKMNSKEEFKNALKSRNVKFLVNDTLPVLKKKLLDSLTKK